MEGQLYWQELKTLEHVSSFKKLFDLVHVYFLRGGGGSVSSQLTLCQISPSFPVNLLL